MDLEGGTFGDKEEFELAWMASGLPTESLGAFLQGFITGLGIGLQKYEEVVRKAFSISQE